MKWFANVGCIVALQLVLGLQSASAELNASRTLEYTAIATHPKTGHIFYIEEHVDRLSQGNPVAAVTRYYSPDKVLWGRLEMNFQTVTDRYSYDYVDRRTGEQHGVRLVDGRPLMYRRDTQKDTLEEKIYRPPTAPITVAGQGFHWYLRGIIKSGAFKVGTKKKIRLLIPGRFDYFTFRLEGQAEEGDRLFIKVDLNSAILRFFAGVQMKLVYDKKSGRLLEYVGPTHIADANGDKPDLVRMIYRY
ncbi:MAG: hypothetical protein VYA30_01950 [Myxococcota bacterium]|nr:hypothetical protein [Myxococcota bacterium]